MVSFAIATYNTMIGDKTLPSAPKKFSLRRFFRALRGKRKTRPGKQRQGRSNGPWFIRLPNDTQFSAFHPSHG